MNWPLDRRGQGETELTEPTEATTFWSGIWWEEGGHDDKASWLEEFEQEFSTEQD